MTALVYPPLLDVSWLHSILPERNSTRGILSAEMSGLVMSPDGNCKSTMNITRSLHTNAAHMCGHFDTPLLGPQVIMAIAPCIRDKTEGLFGSTGSISTFRGGGGVLSEEVSPLDPLPYPFPGSRELFEKFKAEMEGTRISPCGSFGCGSKPMGSHFRVGIGV